MACLAYIWGECTLCLKGAALWYRKCVCGQPKCLCHVWVSGRVDATRGGVHAPRAAHLRRCGEMAQFDVACGAKITQYQPATWPLLFHLWENCVLLIPHLLPHCNCSASGCVCLLVFAWLSVSIATHSQEDEITRFLPSQRCDPAGQSAESMHRHNSVNNSGSNALKDYHTGCKMIKPLAFQGQMSVHWYLTLSLLSLSKKKGKFNWLGFSSIELHDEFWVLMQFFIMIFEHLEK